jgi:hypothetical protein
VSKRGAYAFNAVAEWVDASGTPQIRVTAGESHRRKFVPFESPSQGGGSSTALVVSQRDLPSGPPAHRHRGRLRGDDGRRGKQPSAQSVSK